MPSDLMTRLLSLVLEQTKNGNLPWRQLSGREYAYIWSGSASSVVLASKDDDGQLPLLFSVFDSEGKHVESVETPGNSWDNSEAWDARVQELWDLVSGRGSAIVSLIADLENLPPF